MAETKSRTRETMTGTRGRTPHGASAQVKPGLFGSFDVGAMLQPAKAEKSDSWRVDLNCLHEGGHTFIQLLPSLDAFDKGEQPVDWRLSHRGRPSAALTNEVGALRRSVEALKAEVADLRADIRSVRDLVARGAIADHRLDQLLHRLPEIPEGREIDDERLEALLAEDTVDG